MVNILFGNILLVNILLVNILLANILLVNILLVNILLVNILLVSFGAVKCSDLFLAISGFLTVTLSMVIHLKSIQRWICS